MNDKVKMPKSIDLSSPAQKIFAGVLIFILILIFNAITPPLVYMAHNARYTVPCIIVLSLLIYNYKIVGNMFLTTSRILTDKWIGLTKVEQLWNYLDFVKKKVQVIDNTEKKIGAIKHRIKQEIDQTGTDYQRHLNENEAIKAKTDKDVLDDLIPKYDNLEKLQGDLRELYAEANQESSDLEYRINTLLRKYSINKDLSTAADAAADVFGGDSEQKRMFDIAAGKLLEETAAYAANVESFQYKIQPRLVASANRKAADQEAGMKLIDEYRNSRIKMQKEELAIEKR